MRLQGEKVFNVNSLRVEYACTGVAQTGHRENCERKYEEEVGGEKFSIARRDVVGEENRQAARHAFDLHR